MTGGGSREAVISDVPKSQGVPCGVTTVVEGGEGVVVAGRGEDRRRRLCPKKVVSFVKK